MEKYKIKATKEIVQKTKFLIMFEKPLSSKDRHACIANRVLSHKQAKCCDAQILNSTVSGEMIGLVARKNCLEDILIFHEVEYAKDKK